MAEPLIEIAAPPSDQQEIGAWVESELAGLFRGDARRSPAFTGGQAAADAALETLDITGYGRTRSQVHPEAERGASRLSPYIRHGLLSLPRVHDHPRVVGAPSFDRFRYQGELLWQEYSRQWYAVFGGRTRRGVAFEPQAGESASSWHREPWPRDMRCVSETLTELHRDGWAVNQARMWLASQWSVRAGAPWQEGEDEMFRHLLDGSRAANRQGWQWVVGGTRNRSYGFARRQVLKRAPAFCDACALRDDCPIRSYAGSVAGPRVDRDLPHDIRDRLGVSAPAPDGPDGVEAVWLTAESLGDSDPALVAHPELPVHFVFDAPLLRRWGLDGKRLVFLGECLADLAGRREVHLWRGAPADWLVTRRRVAATRAPVPGFRRLFAAHREVVSPLAWPWLRPPTPALIDALTGPRFPIFRDWCRLTRPGAAGPEETAEPG